MNTHLQNRRKFLKNSFALALITGLGKLNIQCTNPGPSIMTVNGAIPVASAGMTLTHEHILVDFIGAAEINSGRYNADEAYRTILPYLQSLKSKGCKTFIECTPAYLGRDVRLLKRLADATGLQIITNTGYYGAAKEKFLPPNMSKQSAEDIAAVWTNEFLNGIDGNNIRPGFMKLSVDNIPFSEKIQKIIKAAALTFKKTGMPIGIHTSNGGKPALEELRLLESMGVPADAWIWIHAQNEKDNNVHLQAARRGGWVSFDGVSPDNSAEYIGHLKFMKSSNLLNKVLISQDAGWYSVGNDEGTFRPYTYIFDQFIPLMKSSGFTEAEINLLLVTNPAHAFSIRTVGS